MNILYSYLTILVSLLVLDSAWILGIAKNFYLERMGFLFQKTVNLTPAALFYVLYACAVLVLVVTPALNNHSWKEALLKGALLGLAAYGAYDLTNHATIAGWPVIMTIVDIAWGVCVTALASVITYYVLISIS